MRKGLAIFFLSVYLMGTTPVGQLCKLPLLFSHFQQHKAESENLSFIDFLKMHYFNGDPKDADYKDDMKLPFKTFEVNTSISPCIGFAVPYFKIERPQFISISSQKIPSSESWHSNAFLTAIWQPPRVA